MNKYVIDINKTNYLRPSEYYYDKNVGSNEWFSQRLYLFRDNFAHLVKPEHPCYFQEESDRLYMREEKCRDIGQCKNCDNCVYIEGYNEMNDNNIHIYCDREVMGLKGINPTKLISMLINDMIAILDKEET